MSFLKFWSSSKKSSSSGKKDDWDAAQEPELEKRRLRHSLSISRSGRFKQRKRERSQIMDKPEIFGSHDSAPTTASSSSSSSLASQSPSETESRRNEATSAHHFHSSSGGNYRASPRNSPKFSCRDVNTGMRAAPGGLRMGHPVVT